MAILAGAHACTGVAVGDRCLLAGNNKQRSLIFDQTGEVTSMDACPLPVHGRPCIGLLVLKRKDSMPSSFFCCSAVIAHLRLKHYAKKPVGFPTMLPTPPLRPVAVQELLDAGSEEDSEGEESQEGGLSAVEEDEGGEGEPESELEDASEDEEEEVPTGVARVCSGHTIAFAFFSSAINMFLFNSPKLQQISALTV
eukprot:1160111-Pelagomonas_calceolata.AAC.1